MYLNDSPHFRNALSLKTKKGAEDRLDKAFNSLPGNVDTTRAHYLHFVISRGPAQFIPVIVIRDNDGAAATFFARLGIYVTNV